jgi:peptidyl-dipeptidase Dcp
MALERERSRRTREDEDAQDNPLLGEWSGPMGGVPPLERVEVAHFEPALEALMVKTLAAVERIAAEPAAPTFDNTLAALEGADAELEGVRAVFGVWSASMNLAEFQAVEREMAPRLAAFEDRIIQNEALFRRIEAVYAAREESGLTPEQQRLAWWYHTNFVRAGAALEPPAKARLSAINQRLAALFTQFTQNVLADEAEQFLVLESEQDLAGLPEELREAAAAQAEARGLPGKWAIANTRSAIDPFLTYADRRDLRERAWRMWVSRGEGEGERDNYAIIREILGLRAERARLLGYPTHAHWRLENTMAGAPERALELLEAVWPAAVRRVREEVTDMTAIAGSSGADQGIEPWDYRYYAERVRQARYELDENQVKPFLQLEQLREALFWLAGELFGLEFAPTGVPVYHPDVRVWRVTERGTDRPVGLFYFDPFARPGKRSGAWMSAFRRQERLNGDVPALVANTCNYLRGRPGEPVLVSWDDARTLFHEFGHALHGLLSRVTYRSLSGTSVPRDYVEFPSQILEHWLPTPEILERFALHFRSGQPIPHQLVERIERAAKFNQGFATAEFLASALVDMRLHLEADGEVDPAAYERERLAEIGMPREIVMRHRLPHFQHIFSSDSYSAAYYSYLWADVLTADAYEAFLEASGLYDLEVAGRLREHVLSKGNTVEPAQAYRAFRGRDPEVSALMRKRGFSSVA